MAHVQNTHPTQRKRNSRADVKPESPLSSDNKISKINTHKNQHWHTAISTALPTWTGLILISSLIFGGCCTNVFALEAIIKDQPSSGPLITFAQFLLTSFITFPSFVSLSAGPQLLFLRPRAIPLRLWLGYTAFFVAVNLLNNWAFAYKISVPLHIILRSGGPVASMGIGYLFNGKKYSRGQVSAVLMLTLGVVTAALADARAKGQSMNVESELTVTTLAGFIILALAMILSAFQGIYADQLYEKYGRDHWKEALFYSHTLSIPLFLPTHKQLANQWQTLSSKDSLPARLESFSPDGVCLPRHTSLITERPTIGTLAGILLNFRDIFWPQFMVTHIPVKVVYLLINAFTQYLCIRGVHLLSAKSSSLTVTVVLNIRKLVSLLLSIYLFGNSLSLGVLTGALFVSIGGALYGFEGTRSKRRTG
ncbi:UPD-GlcNAc transporter (Mnn2-2) [Aspergillus heteromorphus CBS 117.55]|uniref:UPD-GlcNAc transporter (Mnn2-2) n=1 Tax=Aspergillus heteromorphus CBS 117.55 TaxID=1448321 RepID=A0A317UYB1_9EURO|nr:UPD-GlcNAc transporter (Mnn2-2) [Aspergillus heteromorphus CBS 117.55]PWY66339.1 UPD-GlcNAc transporter (Mnn2-2) [Aspergillus heteromorphus CBS 117.55]